LRERVLGTECEFALVSRASAGKPAADLGDEELHEHLTGLAACLVKVLHSKPWPRAGEFLGNGGRFYIDRGEHPEYATPECRSVRELVAHEKAGERLLQELVLGAQDMLLAREGQSAWLRALKNNGDCWGNSYGGHENYLVESRVMEGLTHLVPFLVTRQIYAGVGKISQDKSTGGLSYQLSHRADYIDNVFCDRTSQVRGIINTRKRDLPRQDSTHRLHIILGDSNMSEYAIALKVGITALVLRLLEEGDPRRLPELAAPVKALKQTSQCLDSPLALAGKGGAMTALQIQGAYLAEARKFFSSRRLSAQEREILELWEQTLLGLGEVKLGRDQNRLEDDPHDLRRRVDWLLKLWLLNRYQEEGQGGRPQRWPQSLNLFYHDIDPGQSVFYRCQDLDMVDRLLKPGEIRRALVEAPQDTRARLRGQIIKLCSGHPVGVVIKDWEKVDLGDSRGRSAGQHFFAQYKYMNKGLRIKLSDPLQGEDPGALERVERFLAELP
jgi:proteasome accessory factor A